MVINKGWSSLKPTVFGCQWKLTWPWEMEGHNLDWRLFDCWRFGTSSKRVTTSMSSRMLPTVNTCMLRPTTLPLMRATDQCPHWPWGTLEDWNCVALLALIDNFWSQKSFTAIKILFENFKLINFIGSLKCSKIWYWPKEIWDLGRHGGLSKWVIHILIAWAQLIFQRLEKLIELILTILSFLKAVN